MSWGTGGVMKKAEKRGKGKKGKIKRKGKI
jgi:hypothetical protein